MKLYFGGPIITMEEPLIAESIVFDKKIHFAGDLKKAKEKFPEAVPIDLKGKTLLPGFIDTHAHLSFAGEMVTQASVFHCTSIDEVLNIISKKVEKLGEKDVLFINGYAGMPIAEARNLTLKEMDNVVPNHPLILRTASTHGTLVNSRALSLIEKEMATIGLFLDEKDRKEGYLRNEANLFAFGMAPKWMNEEQKRIAQEAIFNSCLQNGIVSVHSLEGRNQKEDPDIFYWIKQKGKTPFDVRIYYQTTDVDEVLRLGLKQIGGCFHCLLDGDLDPGTAAFREPYVNNSNNCGVLYFTDEDLEKFFTKAHLADLQICMHAIGDRAIEQALHAYEKVLKKYPKKDHRHRIEHFEVCAQDLIEKAKKLGIVLAMQPVFDYYWPYENYKFYIGEERAKKKCALRPILDAGIPVGGGSDWPVTEMNPFLGIHGAVNHSVPSSRISVLEALRLYTVDAAFLGFEENLRGSLKAGKEADFVIVSDNPLSIEKKSLEKIQVLETIFQGDSVWKK